MSIPGVIDQGIHHCSSDCECFIECPECSEPFCSVNSTDGEIECIDHSGGDWDIRTHKHLNIREYKDD